MKLIDFPAAREADRVRRLHQLETLIRAEERKATIGALLSGCGISGVLIVAAMGWAPIWWPVATVAAGLIWVGWGIWRRAMGQVSRDRHLQRVIHRKIEKGE